MHACWVAQSCLTLCNPMDCSPPGSSARGILQARILEWVAISFSRRSSWPRDRTHVSYVSCIAGGFFTAEPPGKPLWKSTTVLILTEERVSQQMQLILIIISIISFNPHKLAGWVLSLPCHPPGGRSLRRKPGGWCPRNAAFGGGAEPWTALSDSAFLPLGAEHSAAHRWAYSSQQPR